MVRRRFAAIAALLASGCFSPGEGQDPPGDRIYFPVGLALTGAAEPDGARHLLIANSDYDLQYNSGTLQLLDLALVRQSIPAPCATDADCQDASLRCDTPEQAEPGHVASYWCVARDGDSAGLPCGGLGERPIADQLLYPGRCAAIVPSRQSGLLADTVRIGAFATDAVYREWPAAEAAPGDAPAPLGRVFIPARGDATLHWADITEDGRIDCGQRDNSGACNDAHRVGDDPHLENTRDLRLSAEPFAIDVTPDGEAVLVSHQTTGRVSLFVNEWDAGPRLEFTLEGLPSRPVGIAALPIPGLVRASRNIEPSADTDYAPGFLVTFRNAPQVHLIRYFSDAAANPVRPFVSRTGVAGISVNSSGVDSRGIAVDASARARAEAECGTTWQCTLEGDCGGRPEAETGLLACLRAVAATPLDVYVANRAPASLLVGHTVPVQNAVQSSDVPAFETSLPLTLGPSRVLVGNVIVGAENGAKRFEPRVFAVCFDSRRIFVYDPLRRRFEMEITTGRGPHAVAVDANAGHLYVAHFTDSYVGVIGIDRRFPTSYGKMLATIGLPAAPRASK